VVMLLRITDPYEDEIPNELTVDSIFYNINRRSIEDFTNNGLFDLVNKLARTSIDPYKYFNEDPIRVLRVIRLA